MALGIVALVILALVQLSSTSVSNTGFSRNNTKATRYAQELSEWLRGQRDQLGWDVFSDSAHALLAPGSERCVPSIGANWGATVQADVCTNGDVTEVIDNLFYRGVVFTSVDASTVQAAITVRWKEANKDFKIESTTRFTNWREL